MLFSKKHPYDYDLAIVGGGSAAFAAAIRGAELGAKVALCEEGVIGGTCVNRGCLPSKNLLHAAELYHAYRSHRFPGLPSGNERAHFRQIIEQKDSLVEEMRKAKYWNILEAYPEIQYFPKRGSFHDPHTLNVGEKRITADKFVIATGSSPSIPPISGIESVPYLTSKEALDLKELPQSLIVIGGGAIGMELGQMYSRFGTKVTVLEALPHILSTEEEPISKALQQSLQEEGMTIDTGVQITQVMRHRHGVEVTYESGGHLEKLIADKLLLATGIHPNTERLHLETIGVKTDERGAIQIDREARTSVPHIWAAGDVTGTLPLVTLAAYQGGIAAKNALKGTHDKVDDTAVPHAIFTSPQVASVGLKEKEAIAQGMKVEVASIPFEHVPKAGAIRDTRGLFRMIVNAKNYQILGVHIVSQQAADLIHIGVLAVQHKMVVGDLIRSIFVYPTLSEVYKIAALSLKKDVSLLSCCAV